MALAGASIAWGIDNNLTQRLSLRDPVGLVRVKALTAGAGSLVIALALRESFPAGRFMVGAMILGALSYGVSILLDTYALRLVGAAREAAYFAMAPLSERSSPYRSSVSACDRAVGGGRVHGRRSVDAPSRAAPARARPRPDHARAHPRSRRPPPARPSARCPAG
jgi:hypothetical protein